MTNVGVYTQEELADALARDGVIPICRGDGSFIVSGRARAQAYDSAQVLAFGSAQVRAYDSAQVVAYDSAQVEAYDSAQVEAFGSAQVRAYGSAQVWAYDSVQVRAYASAQVRAYASAQVEAYDSAQVEATRYVAVTVRDDGPQVQGGVVIRVPDLAGPREWCAYHGIAVDPAGCALLYKAVDVDWQSLYGATYRPGTEVSCPDWDPVPHCGGGLHFSPRPWMAERYFLAAKRYVACRVRVDEMVVIDDSKAKAPRCWPEYECDRDGQPMVAGVPDEKGER